MRMNKKIIFLVLIFIRGASSQLSVSNLFEYQLGNLPDTDPSNLTTHYDQVNISYRYTKNEDYDTIKLALSSSHEKIIHTQVGEKAC